MSKPMPKVDTETYTAYLVDRISDLRTAMYGVLGAADGGLDRGGNPRQSLERASVIVREALKADRAKDEKMCAKVMKSGEKE